jgi:IS30 family transposase
MLPISPETDYQHVYADKAQGGTLRKNLRCQKKKRKRYASGRDRRGQIPNRRPLSEQPLHIEARKQVGHWKGIPMHLALGRLESNIVGTTDNMVIVLLNSYHPCLRNY